MARHPQLLLPRQAWAPSATLGCPQCPAPPMSAGTRWVSPHCLAKGCHGETDTGVCGSVEEALAQSWVTVAEGWVTVTQGWVTLEEGWVKVEQSWVTVAQG